MFAQHLPTFGWEPVILTVHEKFYEEKLDYNLVKLLPHNLRIEKVHAYPIGNYRFIGDIGLRGFFQLYKKAKQLIKEEHFDFLFIPIPSFYCALLGRKLHASTGIKYGIDYIDPWVHNFPGSEKLFSRHWFSTMLARILEPIAVKKASLITGVAEGYYLPVLERNSQLKNIVTGAMPYGGEIRDHEVVATLKADSYLFKKNENKLQLVYAGAMLPKAYEPLEEIFKVIEKNKSNFEDVEIHFIGTGKKPDDVSGFNIKPFAEKYGLWDNIIFEYPARIPYFDVLVHLNNADAVFILGSTEPHYTPSKVYQAVLSEKPILALLHQDSSAGNVVESSNVGIVLRFQSEKVNIIEDKFVETFKKFRVFITKFNKSQILIENLPEYSAKAVTKKMALLLEKAIS